MNYPGQQQGYGRPRRKPNFFLLLMLGAMAFFLYTQYQSSQQQAAVPDGAAIPEIKIPDISNDGPRNNGARPSLDPHANPAQFPMPSGGISGQQKSRKTYRVDPADSEISHSGDWSMEEGVSTPNGQTADNTFQSSAPKKTSDGDWSIEEGSSTPNARNGDNTLQPSSAPKKTSKGDWAIEEVQKN